jgi:hypothetical protein
MRSATTIARSTAIRSSLQTIVGLQPLTPASTSAPEVLEPGWLLDAKIGGPPPQEIRRLIHRVASEPSPSAETMGWSTTICPDCLVTRPKSPA